MSAFKIQEFLSFKTSLFITEYIFLPSFLQLTKKWLFSAQILGAKYFSSGRAEERSFRQEGKNFRKVARDWKPESRNLLCRAKDSSPYSIALTGLSSKKKSVSSSRVSISAYSSIFAYSSYNRSEPSLTSFTRHDFPFPSPGPSALCDWRPKDNFYHSQAG